MRPRRGPQRSEALDQTRDLLGNSTSCGSGWLEIRTLTSSMPSGRETSGLARRTLRGCPRESVEVMALAGVLSLDVSLRPSRMGRVRLRTGVRLLRRLLQRLGRRTHVGPRRTCRDCRPRFSGPVAVERLGCADGCTAREPLGGVCPPSLLVGGLAADKSANGARRSVVWSDSQLGRLGP